MSTNVIIAHAEGEEGQAEKIADPIRKAGYGVAHRGTVMVGESIIEDVSRQLNRGAPVVLCGTVRAVGTPWAHRIVNAVQGHASVRVFCVRMEKDAYVEQLSLGGVIAE